MVKALNASQTQTMRAASGIASPAMPAVEALAELRACAGTQFDPVVVEALEAVGPARPASGEIVQGVLARLETPSPAL